MFLADTLRRAYLPDVSACDFKQTLELVDPTIPLALAKRQPTATDHRMFSERSSATDTHLTGLARKKTKVSDCIHAYYDVRDELTVQGHSIFKGQHPLQMRKK